MTRTGNHPVDSATRACCQGIGRHTPDCREQRQSPDVPLPAGAVYGDLDWSDWDGYVFRGIHGSDRVVVDDKGKTVAWLRTTALQLPDGSVAADGEEYPTVDIYLPGSEFGSAQARELAGVLLQAADELDRWVR